MACLRNQSALEAMARIESPAPNEQRLARLRVVVRRGSPHQDDEAVAEHQHEEREHDQEVHEVGDDLIERQHKRREPEDGEIRFAPGVVCGETRRKLKETRT